MQVRKSTVTFAHSLSFHFSYLFTARVRKLCILATQPRLLQFETMLIVHTHIKEYPSIFKNAIILIFSAFQNCRDRGRKRVISNIFPGCLHDHTFFYCTWLLQHFSLPFILHYVNMLPVYIPTSYFYSGRLLNMLPVYILTSYFYSGRLLNMLPLYILTSYFYSGRLLIMLPVYILTSYFYSGRLLNMLPAYILTSYFYSGRLPNLLPVYILTSYFYSRRLLNIFWSSYISYILEVFDQVNIALVHWISR